MFRHEFFVKNPFCTGYIHFIALAKSGKQESLILLFPNYRANVNENRITILLSLRLYFCDFSDIEVKLKNDKTSVEEKIALVKKKTQVRIQVRAQQNWHNDVCAV